MVRALLLLICSLLPAVASAGDLPPLKYNSPGLVVDLHVGLWAHPVPFDFDSDGDLDLLVSCPDKPTRATLLFENVDGPGVTMPTFKPGMVVGPSLPYLRSGTVGEDGQPRMFSRNFEVQVVDGKLKKGRKVFPQSQATTLSDRLATDENPVKIRGRQFSTADYDGDGRDDLVIGIGDWTEYGMNFSTGTGGWSNAYSPDGVWQPGPLHGFVYVALNTGNDAKGKPKYGPATAIVADGQPVDVFGQPSPCLADFDGDGDLDLICGEFLDGFTYFANTGSRTEPQYAAGRRLTHRGEPLVMDLQMITPVAVDWDRDGDVDLVCGDEDGRVALIEHTGQVEADGTPQFRPPAYFRQQADDVVIGALVTPVAIDWDGDGDTDLVCGNSAGHIQLLENLGGEAPDIRWAAPAKLRADGTPIRPMAGYNGSVQGPSEQKWGYTTLDVADWNGDDLPDLVVNSVWGKVIWYENVGTPSRPRLTAARPVLMTEPVTSPEGYWWQPEGRELVTQWRTTPVVRDWNGDGRADLTMLDREGYLAFYERTDDGLLPPRRIFESTGPSVFDNRDRVQDESAGPLRLTSGVAGRGGRRKLCWCDWNGDEHPDLLVNSVNASLLTGQPLGDGRYELTPRGPLANHELAGHTTSPTAWDWTGDGRDDAVIGAEDGKLYWLRNPAQ